MNNADIAGIVCIVVGLLLVIPALYASPIFLIVSGLVVAVGIVMIVTGGSMCSGVLDDRDQRDKEKDTSGTKKDVWVEVTKEETGQLFAPPPLTMVVL